MQHSEPTFLMLGSLPTELELHEHDASSWAMDHSELSDETEAYSCTSLVQDGDARFQASPCCTQEWIEVDSNQPAILICSCETRSATLDAQAGNGLVPPMDLQDAGPDLEDLSPHVCASEEAHQVLTSQSPVGGKSCADQYPHLSDGDGFHSAEEDDWVIVEPTSPPKLTSAPSFVLGTDQAEARTVSPATERREGACASCFDVQRSASQQAPHQILRQDTQRPVRPGRGLADVAAVSAEATRCDGRFSTSLREEQPQLDTGATARASCRIGAYGTARVASRLSSKNRSRAVAAHASHMTTHSSQFHGSKHMQPPALAEFLKVIEEFGTCQWLEQLLKMLGCLSSGPPVVLAGLPLFADF